jgi:hypothetical protein
MTRFNTRSSLDKVSGALTLVAMAGLTFASAATLAQPAPAAEPVLHQLPTVVVSVKKATVHQLPTVFVTSKRSTLG